jgi:hypothetical protein
VADKSSEHGVKWSKYSLSFTRKIYQLSCLLCEKLLEPFFLLWLVSQSYIFLDKFRILELHLFWDGWYTSIKLTTRPNSLLNGTKQDQNLASDAPLSFAKLQTRNLSPKICEYTLSKKNLQFAAFAEEW